jgi:hypothetical protein
MATSNTALQVADLDFFTIKENLKNFLRSQSTFTDYDFEGSGMSVLLDVLAYNTYYNSFYLNMAANESFLDTAQVRNNILSHAKLINYVPDSPHGSVSLVNVIVTPSTVEDRDTNVITLEKYTKLVGQDKNGINYPYVTLNSNTSYKSGDAFSFANVIIKQGEVITQQFLVEPANTKRRFQLPSANVDTDTLIVTVQESASNTMTTEYKLAEDLTEISSASNVYYVEEDDQLKYTIYFGDGVLGRRPKDGNIVIATYLDTVGSVSNNISKFKFTDPVGGPLYRDNVTISTISTSYGGTDKEDIEKIRFRAPYYYTAQNRAVTVKDYESIITKDYNNIDSVSIWGGEDNDPVVYGKVYLSLKTRGYYALSNLEKENIKNTLIENRNILTIVPEIVDPDYIFLIIKGRVTYNPSLTSLSNEEIKNIVKNAIIQYNNDELSKFKSTFKKSKLQYYIENAEKSITASDVTIYMQKRLKLTTNQSKNYVINFNSPLKKGDFIEKIYSFPQFTVIDSSNILRNVFIEEVPNSFTGIDSINVTNAGANYETTPTVTITGDGSGATAYATLVGTRLKSITVTNKGINYSRATVTITGDGSEATASAVLEAKNGVLRSFYYKANGEKVVVNDNAGTVDYNTGRIILNAVNPLGIGINDFYDTDVVTVNVVPNSDIVYPLRNRILAIDENNYQSIQLEVVAES